VPLQPPDALPVELNTSVAATEGFFDRYRRDRRLEYGVFSVVAQRQQEHPEERRQKADERGRRKPSVAGMSELVTPDREGRMAATITAAME
jgi:hypothetical protein